jgi:DNA polymerase III epsilon subunit-like protein
LTALDVPDASVCVIDRAEQFGLSQLHQIRGRIGRGAANPSEKLAVCQCFLVTSTNASVPEAVAQGTSYDGLPETAAGPGMGGFDQKIVHSHKNSTRRLEFLAQHNDCFDIADFDVHERGTGDIFGMQQHGDSEYRIASIVDHRHLLASAKQTAKQLWDGAYPHLNTIIGKDDDRVKQLIQIFSAADAEPDLGLELEAGAETDVSRTPKKVRKEKIKPVSSELHPSERGSLEVSCAKVSFHAENNLFVILDLESTGFGRDARIIQFAAKIFDTAVSGLDHSVFNAYIKPETGVYVPPEILKLTNISLDVLQREGVDFSLAWTQFVRWLDSARRVRNVSINRNVVILAHNGRSFDFRLLAAEYTRLQRKLNDSTAAEGSFPKLWTEHADVDCLVDTLQVFRDRRLWDFAHLTPPLSYSMASLHQHILKQGQVGAHNAFADVLALEKMLLSDGVRDHWKQLAEEKQFVS